MNGPDRNALPLFHLAARDEVGLLLIRHASTAWNRERRLLGRTDLPLDAEGEAQAQALAHRLAEIPLAALYSSPLRRAMQTAQALEAAHPPLKVVPVPDLVELDQGALEGLSAAELFPAHAEFFARWRLDPTDERVPGGETLGEAQARALPAIRALAAAHAPGELIAVVLHQMVLSATLCGVMELPLSHYGQMSQKNTAINLLTWRDGALRVAHLNDAAHLDGL